MEFIQAKSINIQISAKNNQVQSINFRANNTRTINIVPGKFVVIHSVSPVDGSVSISEYSLGSVLGWEYSPSQVEKDEDVTIDGVAEYVADAPTEAEVKDALAQ